MTLLPTSLSHAWRVMSFYQRFETVIAFLITGLTTLVIIVAMIRLSAGVVGNLVFGSLNPLDHRVFQDVFGQILTVLIALEFNHTLQYVVAREQSIIQTRVILMIALLAVARKLIVLDLHDTTSDMLFGLAAMTLALGVVSWLLHHTASGRAVVLTDAGASPGAPSGP